MHRWLVCVVILFSGVAAPLWGQTERQERRGAVSGRVLGPGSVPVPNIRVSAVGAVADAQVLVSLGETDASGRYRLDDIPPGRYLIAAGPLAAPTYFPRDFTVPQPVAVVAGETTPNVDIVLSADAVPPPPLGNVKGKVTGVDGQPAVDAPIAAIVEPGRIVALQHTTESGEYFFSLPPGNYTIGVPYLKSMGEDVKAPSGTKPVAVTSQRTVSGVDLTLSVPVRDLPKLLDIVPQRQGGPLRGP